MVKKQMTMTRLPGSPTIFLHSLSLAFSWIRERSSTYKDVTILSLSQWIRGKLGWEKSSVHAARFIRKAFLTVSANQTLCLDDWAQDWLAIEDDTVRAELLFDYLDDSIFFFGEILELLDTPKTSSDLLDTVVSIHPKVRWHTAGLLGARLDWLMACGKVYKSRSLYCLSPIVRDDREIVIRQYRDNLDAGEKGEQFVLAYEKESLKDTPHLVRRVRRVSLYAPRAGYDVQSYFPDGRLKFIEVKATPSNDTRFEMTHNELMTAKRLGDSYYIYRVTNVNDNPEVIKFQNPSAILGRQPLVWRMRYFDEGLQDVDELSEERGKSVNTQRLMDTLLQELPKEENIFVVKNSKWTFHNKIFIRNWEDSNTYCLACEAVDKPCVLVGVKSRQDILQLQLCVDCFLKLRDLFM